MVRYQTTPPTRRRIRMAMSKTKADLDNLALRLREGIFTPEDLQIAAKMIVFYESSFQQLWTTIAAYKDFVEIMGLKSRADAHIQLYFDEAALQPSKPAKPKRKKKAKRQGKSKKVAAAPKE